MASVSSQTVITLDASSTYQTMSGWEGTAQAGQLACGSFVPGSQPLTCLAFQNYRDELYDALVDDLGINRLRVELYPAIENTTDYFTEFLEGEITERDWVHTYAPQIVNDNASADHLDPDGFQFSMLDHQIDSVVLPLRQRLATRGEHLFLNFCYVDFRSDPSAFQHYNNPSEYAEFVVAVYLHMQARYGFVPDTWEVILEPDNTPFDGTKIGQAIQATAPRLEAAGFTPRFVAPSTTNMSNAKPYFEAIKAVIGDSGVRQYLAELSYHRYAGVSDSSLEWIGDTARTYGIGAAMLEHIGSGYENLHKDLSLGGNTAWSQFTLAFPFQGTNPDDGASYYAIDDTNPSSPVVLMGSRTKFLRQYFKFVRAGALRIGATGSSAFDPLAFVNRDGRYVVVVKADAGGSFAVDGLPAGTYGINYTTGSHANVNLPDVTLGAGALLTTSIPASGVITVYAKSSAAIKTATLTVPPTTPTATPSVSHTPNPPTPQTTATASPMLTSTPQPSPTFATPVVIATDSSPTARYMITLPLLLKP